MSNKERYYKIADICYKVTGDCFSENWNDGVLRHYFVSDEKGVEFSDFRNVEINIVDSLSEPFGKLVYRGDHTLIFLDDMDTELRYEGSPLNSYTNAYIRIERRLNTISAEVKPNSCGSKSLLKAMELEHFISERQGILLHAAYICVNGEAVLFTAPSGVGKSTQADLWCKYRDARLINGDRCAVLLNGNSVMVHGVPYCGSSMVNFNSSLPLRAIVCLSQSLNTHISRISGVKAFMRLWGECCINTWNSLDVDTSASTVSGIVDKIPIFDLSCTPDISAVVVLERAMEELN